MIVLVYEVINKYTKSVIKYKENLEISYNEYKKFQDLNDIIEFIREKKEYLDLKIEIINEKKVLCSNYEIVLLNILRIGEE